jgi:hypothetical protein
MLRNYPALVLGATLLSLGACSTTTFTSTWKAADGQTINPAGKTIAAVFVSGDERNRHAAEDALNPKDLDSLVHEVADATAKEMAKQGLLARQ